MLIGQVAHYASFNHGLSGDLDAGLCPFEPETARSVRYLLKEGLIERRERTVDLKPQSYGGNWPEIQSVGPTKIVTWHLTPAGRDRWLAGKL
jgi:hypothetical protein